MISNIGWNFDNTYSKMSRILLSKVDPVPTVSPNLVLLNSPLSKQLNLDFSKLQDSDLAKMLSGNLLPPGSMAIAQAYAGHQFGYFTMLGDGRAVLLGEHINKYGVRFDIQLKGSGKTPYSRSGDGRAALGPVLREYIISEAMYALGIQTTRALSVVTTGENVVRETLLPGAVLTRVASSHLRVGTFQYVAMKNDLSVLRGLVNYTIDRHYPHLVKSKNKALELLKNIIEKQINLIVDWMRVGFVHGVMNTDNMSVSGETIDYGPCAFMNSYNIKTVFSSIDHQGRYCYGNQPVIAHWNLLRFAEALLPLINKNEKKAIDEVNSVFSDFNQKYKKKWLGMMKNKLGLLGENNSDESLVGDLLGWMESGGADFTNTFIFLTENKTLKGCSFDDGVIKVWLKRWKERINSNKGSLAESIKIMKKNNPLIIPRNHIVERVLEEAVYNKNFSPLKRLIVVLKNPYMSSVGIEEYQDPPAGGDIGFKTFCGT
tara:strand:- start:562 stop:2022 length:1461 start_codon:yes stop_codon:yes gene_type:complete